MFKKSYIVTPSDGGIMVKAFLKRRGYTSSLMTELRRESGRMRADGAAVFANYVLTPGQTLEVFLPDEQPAYLPSGGDAAVYQDDEYVVLDKPAGMAVHPSRRHLEGTLANVFAGICPGQTFRALNRLDRDTSGLVLCARSKLACSGLSDIEKEYLALVPATCPLPRDDFGDGIVNMPIQREKEGNVKRTVSPEGQWAVTRYRILSERDGIRLLSLRLATGRTHQIRVHMAHMGLPLLGDSLYGGDTSLIGRQALHLSRLSFTHPEIGVKIALTSPLPPDMAGLIGETPSIQPTADT